MTPKDFCAAVQIVILPESPELWDERGGYKGEQTFWLHTIGMSNFKRPELELRSVPGIYLQLAGAMLNTWALHSIDKAEIEAGESILDESGFLPVVLTAEESTDPWYVTRGLKALRLVVSGYPVVRCDHPFHNPASLN